MLEVLEKIILAGAGLVSMTKEKAEKIVDALIEKGKVKAKDRKTVLNRLLKTAKKLDKELEQKMKQVALKMGTSSQKQIDVLKKKLSKVAKDLHLEKKR